MRQRGDTGFGGGMPANTTKSVNRAVGEGV